MSQALDAQTIKTINQYDGEQRYKYFVKTAIKNQQIWILNDDDGCVMLTTEDEDCVPVWPNEAFAKAWASGEWEGCQAKCIELDKWLKDWTPGLLDDDLCIVVFPTTQNGQHSENEEGLVVFADELDFELRQKPRR